VLIKQVTCVLINTAKLTDSGEMYKCKPPKTHKQAELFCRDD